MKHPKVIEAKLGQRQADGIMEYDENTIYIDIRLRGKRKLDVYIHEFTHHQYPEWTEEEVTKHATELAHFLWRHHVRFVENK